MSREAMMVKVTNGVAIGGLSLPAWWPTLAEASNVAAMLVPIASLAWLALQIAIKLWPILRRAWGSYMGGESGSSPRTLVFAISAAAALAVPIVAAFEGRSLIAYRDIVGIPTICDGETRGVKIGDRATMAQCDAMTLRAVAQFDHAIAPCLPQSLPTQTRAAFISAAYNIGAGAFCASTMARRAKAGDLRGACDALLLWNRAGGRVVRGLVNRRHAERRLCLRGLP